MISSVAYIEIDVFIKLSEDSQGNNHPADVFEFNTAEIGRKIHEKMLIEHKPCGEILLDYMDVKVQPVASIKHIDVSLNFPKYWSEMSSGKALSHQRVRPIKNVTKIQKFTRITK